MPAASSSLMVFKPHGASSTTLRSQLPCWGACRIATLTERVEPVTTKRNRSPENRRPREDALRRLEMLPSSLLDEPSTFLPIEGERSAVLPLGRERLSTSRARIGCRGTLCSEPLRSDLTASEKSKGIRLRRTVAVPRSLSWFSPAASSRYRSSSSGENRLPGEGMLHSPICGQVAE
jgi:hypothetical protein